ncbi:hypothetical protein K1T71_014867 [Dendrolimus kikuchii]|nr:hypothetical protein K1T71_014867 [Dendrolimus kikuchii]
MQEKYKLIKFVIKIILLDLSLVISQLDVSFNKFDITDYDIYSNNKNDLQKTFIERKQRKKLQQTRLKLLEGIFNDTIINEGIVYTKIDENNNDFKKIMIFEDAFKNVSKMDGLKVMFKRDMFWRTWRLVQFGKEKKIVCYKCENVKNCSSCYGGGHWTIEESPLCPYEIFSLIDEDSYCTVNYMKNVNLTNRSCLLIVKHATLAESCDNPIETKWRVTRLYAKGKRSKRYFPNVICNGRENCEFSTVYKGRSCRRISRINDTAPPRLQGPRKCVSKNS